MKNVTEAEFETEVLNSEVPVLVDFWAPWCGPCRSQAPILEQLSKELGESLKIVKVNVDDESTLAQTYGIMSIPTMIFFKNGKPYNKSVGVKSAEALKEML